MRAAPLVLVLLAAPLAAGAPGTSQSGHATGAFVLQEWDVHDFWLNATGDVNLVVDWRASSRDAVEDLSVTIYNPGVWDRYCPPDRSTCTFVQRQGDVYAQTVGCPPFNGGDEGGLLEDMPAGRYHVVVEGNLGLGVPYTLRTDSGVLGYNETTRLAGVVYVPPC